MKTRKGKRLSGIQSVVVRLYSGKETNLAWKDFMKFVLRDVNRAQSKASDMYEQDFAILADNLVDDGGPQ